MRSDWKSGNLWQSTKTIIKSINQLGLKRVGLFGLYRLGISTGYYRWVSTRRSQESEYSPLRLDAIRSLIPDDSSIPTFLTSKDIKQTTANADEILQGKYRFFGGPAAELILTPPGTEHHWTLYDESGTSLEVVDIKQVWESGRFGWAIVLARAYYLSGDERYAQGFWEKYERFLQANPANYGPNWISAQEVAIRLICIAFALVLLEDSEHTTSERRCSVAKNLALHARRIPTTLTYARAQNNNHLLVEAVGLYTAAVVLPGHKDANKWSRLGWYWIDQALQGQIFPDGSYSQHSTNYHRLMLQASLWAAALARSEGRQLPNKSCKLLRKSVAWLASLMDRESGEVPNLGPNDGALILPLSSCEFADYRPIVQAAGMAFLNRQLFTEGPWNEEVWWLGFLNERSVQQPISATVPNDKGHSAESPIVIRDIEHDSWAYFRCARFTSRPGHADQLHFDLWWRGKNIALDAGTYSYNAPHPWDNVLTQACVHNTVTINDFDQMKRAGRFLYLDWAQGEIVEGDRAPDAAIKNIVCQHDGYRWLGVIHRREVINREKGQWALLDHIITTDKGKRPPIREYTVRLHWLLLDLPWELNLDSDGGICEIQLQSPDGMITLNIDCIRMSESGSQEICLPQIEIARAGEMLYGRGQAPAWRGWRSPTYLIKEPALSLSATLITKLPITLRSEWRFEAER